MKRTLAVICLLATISVNAAPRTVLGTGLMSCGKWNKEQDRIMKGLYVSWVLGYVSALNFTNTNTDALKNTDSDAVESAIDKFCLQNPLEDVHDASNDVFLQLLRMAR